MTKKVFNLTRLLLLLGVSVFATACTKGDDTTQEPPKPLQKILVKEYPSLGPAPGVKIRLNKYDFWGNAVEVGTFTTNSEGIVETDKTFSAKASRVLAGEGYIPVDMQNDTLKIPEFYVAKPCWVRLQVRNASPAGNQDFCYVRFSQTDTLRLPVTRIEGSGWAGSSGWEKYFEGANINHQAILTFAKDVPFYLSIGRTKNTFGVPVIDTTIRYFTAKNDTLPIRFEY